MMPLAKCHPAAVPGNEASGLPRVSPRLVSLFGRYLRHYVPRHFHAVGVSFAAPVDIPTASPLIVYGNHASWWDPLIALVLARHLFPERTLYAPIDLAALKRYPLLERLGFFGVDRDSVRGAAQFLQTARQILQQPAASIWLTPEGRFTDPRDHLQPFEPGLAHLICQLSDGFVLPLAVEYAFWEERLPEVLLRVGQPISVSASPSRSKAAWATFLPSALRQLQSELADDSIHRRSERFQVLMAGKAGVGGCYDLLRRGRAWFTGQPWDMHHGGKLR